MAVFVGKSTRGGAGIGDEVPELPLAALFECEVVVAQAVPRLVDEVLYREEQAYLVSASDRRRAEFGTARICARRALARLGVMPCPLVPHEDRSPWWPPGVVGSISHTEGHCAVVLASSSQAAGLGLDLEVLGSTDREMEALVCTQAERQWLDGREDTERSPLVRAIFSAKEAFYKCYPHL
jgi:4'-phosphopantetheinyl transferase EntD